jgi:hypothetical protein
MSITFIAAGFAETLRSWLTGWFGAILALIPKTIYALCTFIFSIMDILQVLIRKVAGLDQVFYTGQDWQTAGGQSGDIAYNFVEHIFLGKTPIISNVFWAMIILGVILLFLTTLIAILRSEYAATDAKSASKGRIVGQAFKAIFSFAVVPIVAFFGMYLANIILQAIDSVTTSSEISTPTVGTGESLFVQDPSSKSYTNYCFYFDNIVPTTTTPISGQIFAASSYKANRIRYYSLFRNNLSNENVGAGVFNLLAANPEDAAELLDDCFSNTYILTNSKTLTTEPFKNDYLYPMGNSASFFSNSEVTFNVFDKNNVALVWYYYDLWSFDYIICIAALVVAGKLLVDLVFGLMKRIFELIILFLIAAPISSLMPLDNGAALGNWRKKFIAKAIGAYAPIAGLNLVFIILPLISTINFFNIAVVDKIVNVIFLLVGLLMIKDLIGTIAEFIGGDDALKAGEGLAGGVGGTLASVGKAAVMPGRFIAAGAKFAGKTGKAVKAKASHLSAVRAGHRAEEGAALQNMSQEDREQLSEFSINKQRKILKSARLSMSSDAREKAHENLDALKNVRSDWGSDQLSKKWHGSAIGKGVDKFSTWASDKADKASTWTSDNLTLSGRAKKKQNKAYQEALQKYNKDKDEHDMNEFISNQSGTNPIFHSYDKPVPKLEDFKTKYQKNVEKINDFKDKVKQIPGNVKDKFDSTRVGGWIKQKTDERTETLTRYKNFNEKLGYTNDKISAQKEKERTQNRKASADIAKEWLNSTGDFLSNFKNALTSISKTLGGEFAKGFKEGGGMGEMLAMLKGASEKDLGISKAVKEQKKTLAAQRKAESLLGWNAKSSAGNEPSKIDISDKSAKMLAQAIAEKLGKS